MVRKWLVPPFALMVFVMCDAGLARGQVVLVLTVMVVLFGVLFSFVLVVFALVFFAFALTLRIGHDNSGRLRFLGWKPAPPSSPTF